jgi:hypothetical protein
MIRKFFSALILAGITLTAWGQVMPPTMIGRQSNNTGIRAVPATGTVKIDGNLDDWDMSGRIWSFADIGIRDLYSAETAVMWSKDYLYLAFKFRDPTPLINTINPAIDSQSGWKGDAVQLRLLTDWPLWITLWKYSKGNQYAMLSSSWKEQDKVTAGQNNSLLVSKPGSNSLGEGVEMASKQDADHRGYVHEVRIPWKLIYKNTPPTAGAGNNFRMGIEYYWGGAGENVMPAHRYADNLQPGATSREFFWTAKEVWGNVNLLAKGQLEPLKYILAGQKLEGIIPLTVKVPVKAKEFTVVIENKEGVRIRNLGAQLNTDLYTVSTTATERTATVLWDGRDDAGKMVKAGDYKVRGLSHQGIGADYIMSFFNPGTPPWQAGTSGNWGADHAAPQYVAAAGDWSILAWGFAEGGSGIIGIGPDGLKKWGEKRGAQALAADEQSVYFISRSWGASGNLCRLNKVNGAYKPFKIDGKVRPFELSLNDIFGSEAAAMDKVVAMASGKGKLALAMNSGKIALLDTASARIITTLNVPALSAIAFGPGGQCYVMSENQLCEINIQTGAKRVIPTPGLTIVNNTKETATQGVLTVDNQGLIGIYDSGNDQQVKFYTPDGKLSYTAGRKGGRPIRGNFDEQAMSHVTSVSVDRRNQIWVTECWEYPRRVSVWAKDGTLIRDYIGNTGYSGTGAFLHDQDPTLAYYGPVEMKLDLVKRTAKVTRILWVPGPGEQFPVPTDVHTHPHRFTSSASGQPKEYMFLPPYRNSDPYVIYMEGANHSWRPVAAIGAVGQLSGELAPLDSKVVRQPEGEYQGLNAYDAYFWNDQNQDGKVQFAELTIVPNPKPVRVGQNGVLPIPFMSGWGGRMAPEDLSFVTSGIARYAPLRFTAEGAPVFGPASIKKYTIEGVGDFVPVLKEQGVVALLNHGNLSTDGITEFNVATGKSLWTYPNPYPSVHGSHLAPMPQPGLVIGSLKILGVANLPGNNGKLFGMRGNLGQDFFMTTDGLFIGTVFQDGRLPSMPLPVTEAELVHQPVGSFGGGSEPFTGWFGSQNDGKVRLTSGIAGQSVMILEMTGLEQIKRFNAPDITITDEQVKTAFAANQLRTAQSEKAIVSRQLITRIKTTLAVDGRGKGWESIPVFLIESKASGAKAKAQLAYDNTYLYLATDVEDPSPWKNEGVDFLRLFKTGDAVDLQIGTDPKASAKRMQPVKGDLRIVLSNLNNQPAAVLMEPVNPTAAKSNAKVYTSPVGDKKFDEVRLFANVKVTIVKRESGYRLEAAVPLKEIGLQAEPGQEFRGDLGFISSDAAGKINTARTYWANKATNLVSDEPLEAWLFPASWGTFVWGK